MVDDRAGIMPGLEPARERKSCWGTVSRWDGGSDETTTVSSGRDRVCEPADS